MPKSTAKLDKIVNNGQALFDSVMNTASQEVMDLFVDFLGVAATLSLRLHEEMTGEAVEDEDEDLDEEFEDEDEDLDDDDEEEEFDDEDEEDLDEEDDDDIEDEDEEDLDEEDDDDIEDEDEEEFDGEDEDEDLDEEDDDIEDEDEDEDIEDEDEDEEESFASLSLTELRNYLKEAGIDAKTVMGTVSISDKEAAQEQLAAVASELFALTVKYEGLKLKTLESRLTKAGITPEYGRVRKEDKKIEIAAEALAAAEVSETHATVKAKAAAKPARKAKAAPAKKARTAKKAPAKRSTATRRPRR